MNSKIFTSSQQKIKDEEDEG